MKPKQITGTHILIFNYKNGAYKEINNFKSIEDMSLVDKGYIKEDVIETLCKDEDKKYNLEVLSNNLQK